MWDTIAVKFAFCYEVFPQDKARMHAKPYKCEDQIN